MSGSGNLNSKDQDANSDSLKNSLIKERDYCVKANPSLGDIVTALAPLLRIEKREVNGTKKEYCVRKCPNGKNCKNKNGEIVYLNKTGFKNPHSHLQSCLAKVR